MRDGNLLASGIALFFPVTILNMFRFLLYLKITILRYEMALIDNIHLNDNHHCRGPFCNIEKTVSGAGFYLI